MPFFYVWTNEMTINNKIKQEQATHLYNQSPLLFIVTTLLTGLIVWRFQDSANQLLVFLWAGLVLLLTAARVKLVLAFKNKNTSKSPQYWLNAFSLGALFSGMLWGMLLLYILEPTLNKDILLLSLIFIGMSAGSVVPSSTYLPCSFSFSTPIILPFSVYLLQENIELQLIGILLVIFLLSMLSFSVMVNRNILRSIRLSFENSDLLDDLKNQKALAEQASIDKSRFLAATSHDLRQPLHALDLYLGALQVQLAEGEHVALVNKASASSQALSELLNVLMDISRLDSGDVAINTKLFSLKKVIESIDDEFELLAQEKGISVELNLAELYVRTDPILLGRMLRNLLSNAINHNQDCTIELKTTKSEGEVVISIKDSGRGIAESELDNIFSEFYQLNNPERDRSKGLGLGLAIVKRLSVLLAIKVDVSSESGKGSEFLLTLPVESVNVKPSEELVLMTNTDLAGLFFIVIEDEEAVRDALRMLLRACGCEVLLASSEQELMTSLIKDNYPAPDIIISDYRLRDSKVGTDAVQRVRDHFKLAIPSIIITGDTSEVIETTVREAGCQLLLKPVNSQTLRNKIEQVIA